MYRAGEVMSTARRVAQAVVCRGRLIACLGLLGGCAAPAQATIETFSFDDVPAGVIPFEIGLGYEDRGLFVDYNACGPRRIAGSSPSFPAHSGSQFLALDPAGDCYDSAGLFFDQPLGSVQVLEVWMRGPLVGSAPLTVGPPRVALETRDAAGDTIETRDIALGDWTRLLFRGLPDRPITQLRVLPSTSTTVGLDEIVTSDRPLAPTVVVDQAPAAASTTPDATIAFSGNEDAASFVCSLDRAPEAACTSPLQYTGLANGPHRVAITPTDRFGDAATDPATVEWTTAVPTPTPTPAPTPTPTPLPTPTPTPPPCTTGPDADRDGVPDACDTVGDLGSIPPVVGVRSSVTVTRGEVFVKLPSASGARARIATASRRRVAEPVPNGFVSLKGAASLPVGTTVDARRGEITLATAAAAAVGRAPKAASTRISAAIFQIRQRRAARKRLGGKPLPPSPAQLVMRSPEGAIRAAGCAAKGARGTVRSLSATLPKGVVRIVGVAAVVEAQRASTTVRAVDRCDGTFVEVGFGAARVTEVRGGRRQAVGSGQSLFVRGNLLRFEGRKGR
jgi:hypothetical protein